VEKRVTAWKRVPYDGLGPGSNWAITFGGRYRVDWHVYNVEVIPHPLTPGGQKSYPEPGSFIDVEKQAKP
jgi:hypothetical protein